MLVQIIVDNKDSWIIPYAEQLGKALEIKGIQHSLLYDYENIVEGDILILLSCTTIFMDLHLNKHNLVIHESALPEGRGWSPLTWKILEGQGEITITLFEAEEEVDSGVIYFQDVMKFEGHELIDELRKVQGGKTIDLVMKFVEAYPNVEGIPQEGEPSYYTRRKPEDSALDIERSISEQFDLLRVCDNERYPAYFMRNGYKYLVKIEKVDE